MISDALKERFWQKVEVGALDECWLWTASTAGRGYGQIKVPGTRQQVYAHRLSYEIANGPIIDEMMVIHSCDTPRCCNPKHLFLGECADNLQDMARKGRHLYGERNTEHRLTEDEVHRIFDLAGAKTQSVLAKEFGVGQMTISRILRGERWRHVWLKRR